jgi:hypothetical protein
MVTSCESSTNGKDGPAVIKENVSHFKSQLKRYHSVICKVPVLTSEVENIFPCKE